MKTKICTRCKVRKPQTAFHRKVGGKDGLHSQCRECRNKQQRGYRRQPNVKDCINKRMQEYYRRPEIRRRINKYRREHRRHDPVFRAAESKRMAARTKRLRWWYRQWVLVIASDGKLCCAGCGRKNDLQIDHINEDGAQHRAQHRHDGGVDWLRYHRSMLESGCADLQVLCGRCNVAKFNKLRNQTNS